MPNPRTERADGRDRKAYYADYYQRNKAALAAARKAKGSTYRKGEHYLSRYGITREQHDQMLAAQGGRCAICQRERKPEANRLHVDHDHDTGEVRGILCGGCNAAVGFIERAGWLARALEYLGKNP